MQERTFGWALLAASYALFFGIWYCAFWTKAFPPPPDSTNRFILAVAADRHYCLVVPWCASVAFLFFGFFAWMGLKLFRHN